jgi:hypothetical protein
MFGFIFNLEQLGILLFKVELNYKSWEMSISVVNKLPITLLGSEWKSGSNVGRMEKNI